MSRKAVASVGSIPTKPGFYWYIPGPLPPARKGIHPTSRPTGICELRAGEGSVRFTDGSRQSWAHEHDQFLGPMLPPNTPWTLFWLDGRVELVTGESLQDAVSNAGYGGGAMRALDFWSQGDERDNYRWDAGERQWMPVKEKASA